MVRQEVSDTGKVGAEIERVQSPHIDRVIEVGLVMDLSTAETIRAWLDSRIDNLREAREAAREAKKGKE